MPSLTPSKLPLPAADSGAIPAGASTGAASGSAASGTGAAGSVAWATRLGAAAWREGAGVAGVGLGISNGIVRLTDITGTGGLPRRTTGSIRVQSATDITRPAHACSANDVPNENRACGFSPSTNKRSLNQSRPPDRTVVAPSGCGRHGVRFLARGGEPRGTATMSNGTTIVRTCV